MMGLGANQDALAEVKGFEPLYPVKDHAFQACAIDHYATPPSALEIIAYFCLPCWGMIQVALRRW